MNNLSKTKVLVLGSSGFLGEYVSTALITSGFDVRSASIKNSELYFDAADPSSLDLLLSQQQPDFIVNTVGIVDVEYCEKAPKNALLVNTLPNIVISKYLRENQDCKLVYVSTDHVYNDTELSSEEEYQLTNIYSKTKYLAEKVLDEKSAFIIRCNFFGNRLSGDEHGILGWAKKNAINGSRIKGFSNIYFNPLRVDILADLIVSIIQNFKPGTYNIGSTNKISKYQFCKIVFQNLGVSADLIERVDVIERIGSAQRPFDMSMDVSKIERLLQVKMPRIEEQLSDYLLERR